MKEVPLSEVRDDLVRFLREAQTQEILITRDCEPVGALIGFGSRDDYLDYCVEHDLRILRRAEEEQRSLRARRDFRLDDLESD